MDRSRILFQLTPSSARQLDDAWHRWQALAKVLLDACDQPAFVLDPDGFVIAANDEMTRLIGGSATDAGIRGGGFISTDTIAKGTSEPGRGFHGSILRRDGVTLVARLVFRGAGTADAFLQFVRVEWARRPYDSVPLPASDRWYVVRTTRSARGDLEVASDANGGISQPPRGTRCHVWLYGRATPCVGCPLLDGGEVESASFAHVEGDEHTVVHASATRLDETSAVVLARRMPSKDIGEVIQARLDALAHERGLSPREHSVLKLASLGRSRSEIASVLGITPRTVKHHIANVYAKLGADSQADLLRVLL